jgi:DeoR/GlpR family transcriptional regulator of sugar metabolism
MLAQERHQIILDLLNKNRVVKVSDLMVTFNVSIETVRRDLDHLESQGFLRKVYGGAVISKKLSEEPSYSVREVAYLEEKRQIGIKCAELVEDGETLIIDLGTTTLEVAKNLKQKKNLTVITNAINIALELINVKDFRVFFAGGRLRYGDLSCSGFLTSDFLKQFNVDTAIIGVGGITLEDGISDYHVEEAGTRRLMIEQSNNVIAVTDFSKFGVKAFTKVCNLSEIDVLVTDWNVDEHLLKKYRRPIKTVLTCKRPE